jgi:hypothetical protein
MLKSLASGGPQPPDAGALARPGGGPGAHPVAGHHRGSPASVTIPGEIDGMDLVVTAETRVLDPAAIPAP